MKILTVLLVLVVIYLIKKKYFNPTLSRPIEIFPSRGVTFTKRILRTYPIKTEGCLNEHAAPQIQNRLVLADGPHSPNRQEATSAPVQNESDLKLHPAVTAHVGQENANSRICIPEESVLKRHCIAQVQAMIESQHVPYPTDSVLKRHHTQLIQSKIRTYLAGTA